MEVKFQFNPKEFTVKKTAEWTSDPTKGVKEATVPEYKGPGPRSISLEAFFDATDNPMHDITRDIEVLFACCTPLPDTITGNRPSPPFVTFEWGRKIQFGGYVQDVSVKYTLFRPDGMPIRALATFTVKEIPTTPGRQNPTSGSVASHRTHTVVQGDSLQSIAYAEYGNPRLWRAVAEANGIDDPMRPPTGSSLLLPSHEDAGTRT